MEGFELALEGEKRESPPTPPILDGEAEAKIIAMRLGKPQVERIALVKGVYPAYISWSEYEQIQEKLEANRQLIGEKFKRREGVRHGAALLTGLVRCGRCGDAMVVAYKGRTCRATRKESTIMEIELRFRAH